MNETTPRGYLREKGGQMTIAEYSEGRIPRHKLLLQTIRIEKGSDADGEFYEYFFKDESSLTFRKGAK